MIRILGPLAALVATATGAAVGPSADLWNGGARIQEAWRLGSVEMEPCQLPFFAGEAWCGTHTVWEDREARAGREIDLRIAVLRADAAEPAPDPVFLFHGGPGYPASQLAPFVAEDLARVRERRHLVMVDRRGTGGSHPLDCPGPEGPQDLQRYFEPRGPADVRECRELLERKADLTLYTTPIAIDDIDEVREAMGFERINLWGGSYGSREALVYLRRHEEHVRGAHIWAVIPPHRSVFSVTASTAQLSMDRLFDDCSNDPACRAAYPNLPAELDSVLARLERQPARFVNGNPQLGGAEEIVIDREHVASTLRFSAVSPGGGIRVPSWIHSAYAGDFRPIGEQALLQRRLPGASRGLFYSVICAEEAARVRRADLESDFRASYWGKAWVTANLDACEEWPRATLGAEFFEPVRSAVPVLIMHGWLDPITPPEWAQELARHLPNARVLVIREGHHNWAYEECGNRILAEFYDRLEPRRLDAGCIAEMRRPEFVVETANRG